MRIVIVGVGGVGGWLAMSMAAVVAYTDTIEDKTMYLIDGDDFEPKNLNRQHFMGAGNKALVRANEITQIYPQVDIVPIPAWIVAEEREKEKAEEGTDIRYISAKKLVEDGDVIFPVVDNFACRALICEAAKAVDNVDIFLSGNDDDAYLTVYHYQRRNGEDVTANPVDFKPELADPPDRNPGELSCEERAKIDGGTQLIATNGVVAFWTLYRFIDTVVRGNEDVAAEISADLKHGVAAPMDRREEVMNASSIPSEDAKPDTVQDKAPEVLTS